MTNNQIAFKEKLIKSIQCGSADSIDIIAVNQFLEETIPTIRQGTISEIYSITLLIAMIIGYFSKEINEAHRIHYLKVLEDSNQSVDETKRNMRYWIRIVFIDFEKNVKENHFWLFRITLLLGYHPQKRQRFWSKMTAIAINKNFRDLCSNHKDMLLGLLSKNPYLRQDTLKIVLKHFDYMSIHLREKVLLSFFEQDDVPYFLRLALKNKSIKNEVLKEKIATYCR